MNYLDVVRSLVGPVFRFLYNDGKSLITNGLTLLAEGFDLVSMKISMWLYNNGYSEWSHRVRLINRFVFNTLRTTAIVLSVWSGFETVSRVAIDNHQMDYIE